MIDEKSPISVKPNIICLMTDRLHLGYLGAYGNGAVGTAAFDRLAGESLLFDRYFTSSLSLPVLYRALWTGEEPFEQKGGQAADPTGRVPGIFRRLWGKGSSVPKIGLAAELAEAGYRTVLLTDEEQLAGSCMAASFEKTFRLSSSERIAGTVEETSFYAGFIRGAQAAVSLARRREPFFLWIHLKGWNGIWDVPQAMRDQVREDDDDPPAYGGGDPPWRSETEMECDLDAEYAVVETYTAGVRLWDASLGLFLKTLADAGVLETSALFLGGARGIPLGEHQRLGINKETEGLLYFEEIHVPLVYRPSGSEGESVRSFGLCGPSDLYHAFGRLAGKELVRPSLLDLASEQIESIRSELRVTQTDAASSRQGLITDNWYFLRDTGTVPPRRELYLCPNDRWNANEVADRAEEGILDELEKKIKLGGFA